MALHNNLLTSIGIMIEIRVFQYTPTELLTTLQKMLLHFFVMLLAVMSAQNSQLDVAPLPHSLMTSGLMILGHGRIVV